MAFEPAPLTANANLQIEIDIEPEVKDSFKCFCCIPVRAVVKSLTPRKKEKIQTEQKTEQLRAKVLNRMNK